MLTRALIVLAGVLLLSGLARSQETKNGVGPVSVRQYDGSIVLDWPLDGLGGRARIRIDLRDDHPLFEDMHVRRGEGEEFQRVMAGVDPAAFLVVGTRQGTAGRPPEMSEFNEFFDSPANRPHQAYASRLEARKARVDARGGRATVHVGPLSAGPFRGDWQITVYAGHPLVHLEAVLKTDEPHRAFLYDVGLMSDRDPAMLYSWIDTEGQTRRSDRGGPVDDRALAVRHRLIVAQNNGGSVVCFPLPHQYFFPRDLTDNQSTAWYGKNHRGLDQRFGFGIRQTERGGGAYVPWFNAPPGTEQRMGTFLLLSRGMPQDAVRRTLRYTNGDRFPEVPGYRTLASHFHMAIAMAALERKKKGEPSDTPDFVRMFKDMNVDMVHLAEFHGDGHPQDPGPLRLAELEAMFNECHRLSDRHLLLIPGEEANVHFGISRPGQHPGHWLYLFPRPVFWTMKRGPNEPFREEDPGGGRRYHVGNPLEMHQLLDEEDGLAWTAHARIKASAWAPDAYRDQPYFQSDRWLGAAWKAMPADLSDDRLGRRVLDLMDDMANWGGRKYVLGEVDVFKLDHTHELYGHMNINYVQIDRAPRYEEGWKPVVDALREGRFFVSTGEVLLPEFRVERRGGDESVVHVQVVGTFPLRFAELVMGDGKVVERRRIDLSDVPSFGIRTLTIPVRLAGKRWIRLEAWDVAANGAFTQPQYLK